MRGFARLASLIPNRAAPERPRAHKNFRKLWRKACKAIGLPGRIVHDLRRSGVKHKIDAGVDPHTVMAFSGHRTASMLRRYHIIDLADLSRAAEQSSRYAGARGDGHAAPTGEEPHKRHTGPGSGRRRVP